LEISLSKIDMGSMLTVADICCLRMDTICANILANGRESPESKDYVECALVSYTSRYVSPGD